MDIVQLFCDVDDFCKSFESTTRKQLLPEASKKRNRSGSASRASGTARLHRTQVELIRQRRFFRLFIVPEH